MPTTQSQKKLLTALTIVLAFAIAATLLLSFSSAGPSDPNDPNYPLADTNADNKVDIFDLSYMLSRWGTTDTTADFNNDNTVSIFDLSYLLAQWGRVDTPGGGGGGGGGSNAIAESNYLQFDGVDDYVNLGAIDVAASALTLEAVVNVDSFQGCSTSSDCRIISKASSTSEQDHYFMLSTTESNGEIVLRFRLKTGTTTTTLIADSGSIVANPENRITHHVAATYDGAFMRIFLDGIEVGSTPKTGEIATDASIPVWVGANPDSLISRPWHGSIDEVRIWNVARTQTEIQNNTDSPLTGSEAGLAHYYRFDATAGQVAVDSAGGSDGLLGSTTGEDINDPQIINNTPDTVAPTAPSNLASTNQTGNSISLSWTEATDDRAINSYRIYRGGTEIDTVPAAETSFVDTNLDPRTAYEYQVDAIDAAGNTSPASNILTVSTTEPDVSPPSSPASFSANSDSATSVSLSWNESTDNMGVVSYILRRDGSEIVTIDHPNTTYSDGGLTPETTYSYTLTAVDAAGNQSNSSAANATTQSGAGSWEEAVDSKDMDQIVGWYDANTGFEACYDDALGRNLRESDLQTYTGSREITQDGTTIYGAKFNGNVKIRASNVSIRCSLVDVLGSYSHGFDINSPDASNYTVEYNTIRNSVHAQTGSYEDRGNRAIYVHNFGASGTARHNKSRDGFGSGIRIENTHGHIIEYNFIDKIVRSPGSHNTTLSLQGRGSGLYDVLFRRNLGRDGTSGTLSFYTRTDGPIENITVQENILDLPHTVSTNYCARFDSSHPTFPNYTLRNVLYDGNIFGQTNFDTCGSSGSHTGGCSGGRIGPGICEKIHNRFLDGTPIAQ